MLQWCFEWPLSFWEKGSSCRISLKEWRCGFWANWLENSEKKLMPILMLHRISVRSHKSSEIALVFIGLKKKKLILPHFHWHPMWCLMPCPFRRKLARQLDFVTIPLQLSHLIFISVSFFLFFFFWFHEGKPSWSELFLKFVIQDYPELLLFIYSPSSLALRHKMT